MAMIGIDLGTTNSLVSTYLNGTVHLIPNGAGSIMTQSAVSMMDDGSIIVGDAAKERLISHPEVTAAYFKQFMGTPHPFRLGDRTFEAHELSALLLGQLKQDAEACLGEAVEEAVISVPAYFNDNQRSATKLAAKLAGLRVNRLINEPSAAALFDRLDDETSESKLLVIDFGGGTLDVSVVDCFENIVEIVAISGDNHLGGQDIDEAIVKCFYEETGLTADSLSPSQRASLYRKAEQAKKLLPQTQTISVILEQTYCMELNTAHMAELCRPIFHRVREVIAKAIKNSGLHTGDITHVVLVGGSSKSEVFSDFLEKLFGTRPQLRSDAEELVARGLGLCCGIKNRDITDVVMTDVCPFSLGVGVHNRADPGRLLMDVLIPRCSMLPSSHTHRLYTVHSNQSQIQCKFYQGENLYADENLKIGELSVRVPPAPAGQSSVNLTFTYDIDGILQIEIVGSGGHSNKTVIVNPVLDINEAELETRITALEQLKNHASGSEGDLLLLAKLERLYCELLGGDRDLAAMLYRYLNDTMQTGSNIALRKCRETINQALGRLETGTMVDLHLSGLADEEETVYFS